MKNRYKIITICFQEFPSELDVDPLTLPEIHEHMIRSPPPITWPKSPNFKIFRFPMQNNEMDSSQVGNEIIKLKTYLFLPLFIDIFITGKSPCFARMFVETFSIKRSG